jgi:hypothetical protein
LSKQFKNEPELEVLVGTDLLLGWRLAGLGAGACSRLRLALLFLSLVKVRWLDSYKSRVK